MSNELNKTGVYFLIKGIDIVYIGKTTKFPQRLFVHKNNKMDFDSVRFMECSKEALSAYEKRWILRFRPIYNSAFLNRNSTSKVEKLTYNRQTKKIFRNMKFRKLTEKSFIGFGNYRDEKVSDLLSTGKLVALVDMYYNLSHITFFDDILDVLGISQEWRIEKPGCNKDKGMEFKRAKYSEEMEKRRAIFDKKSHSISKICSSRQASILNNKEYLMNANRRKL